jgi:hypothetical protein
MDEKDDEKPAEILDENTEEKIQDPNAPIADTARRIKDDEEAVNMLKKNEVYRMTKMKVVAKIEKIFRRMEETKDTTGFEFRHLEWHFLKYYNRTWSWVMKYMRTAQEAEYPNICIDLQQKRLYYHEVVTDDTKQ